MLVVGAVGVGAVRSFMVVVVLLAVHAVVSGFECAGVALLVVGTAGACMVGKVYAADSGFGRIGVGFQADSCL